MSFDSFYGGRQGASFVIVKQFDGIDLPANTYKAAYLAGRVVDNEWCYIYTNGDFIRQTTTNYKNYSWKMHALDKTTVKTVSKTGTTKTDRDLPEEFAEGMRQCFEKGGDTTDIVNYGEYVIIDTPSKEDPTNGQVYRRGMNYIYDATSNPLAGAEYIGQIVGPKGSTADIDIEKYNTIIEEYDPHQAKTYTVTDGDLLPGAEKNRTTFHDNINYAWANVRDSYGNIESYLIGFQIPYLVTDMTASWRKPYYTSDDVQQGKATQSDVGKIIPESANFELFIDNGWNTGDTDPTHGDTGHPFYRKWRISVPKGIKGDTTTELKIYPTIVAKGSKAYSKVNTSTGVLSGTEVTLTADTPIIPDSYWDTFEKGYVTIKHGNSNYYCYLTDTVELHYGYLWTWYDTYEDGREHKWIDIGAYRTIDHIHLDENGWVTVYYKAGEPDRLEEVLRWIWLNNDPEKTKGVQLDDDGTVTIWYNTLDSNGNHEYQRYDDVLVWIKDTSLDREGHFKTTYNNETLYDASDPYSYGDSGWTKKNSQASWETDLTWPTQVSLTPEGVLKFMYNNNLLDDIYPNPWTGSGIVDRTNGTYSFIIPWLEKVKLLRDGHFNFEFNNDELYDPNDPDWASRTKYAPRITWNTKVSLDDNGQLRVYYNNDLNSSATVAGGGIWVDGPDPEDPTKIAHYYNKQLLWVADVQIDNDGTIHFIYCDGTTESIPGIKIKYLTDVQIQTADASGVEGTGDQKVHVTYNTGLSEAIGEPLNYIIETIITGPKQAITDPEEYHLLVYYADPATRARYKADPAYQTYSYYCSKLNDVVDDWVDLGYVKGEPGGIHIITNFTDANDLIDSSTGNPIKPEYINGSTPGVPMQFPNLDHAGWAVTIEDNSSTPSTYSIYFYDYDHDLWYSIGTIDASLIDPRNIIITAEETDYTEVGLLNSKGIWLVESTRVFVE